LLALLLGACYSFGAPAPPLHPYNPPGAWYVVQAGETLAQLAARAGVPIDDLREINGLQPGEAVSPGRLLYVLYGEKGITPRIQESPAEIVGSTPIEPARMRWPLAVPQLSSPFGFRQGRSHDGIDLAAPTGTPIFAAEGGKVLYAGDQVKGYGNMVVVEHVGGILTVYAHGSVLLVRTGDAVTAGQEIARVGQTGRSTAPHLHFEVRKGDQPQNPMRFLPALTAPGR
jgi:murein DD-endopeptidase MepM/ murein hydrolase activator NlpD